MRGASGGQRAVGMRNLATRPKVDKMPQTPGGRSKEAWEAPEGCFFPAMQNPIAALEVLLLRLLSLREPALALIH